MEAETTRLLDEMGDTPAKVAWTIKDAGVLGQRCSPNHCPVVSYLKSRLPGHHFAAGVSCVHHYHARDGLDEMAILDLTRHVSLPHPVREFVRAFDRGEHPALEG